MLLLGTAITSLVFFVAGVIPNQLPAVWTLTVVALVASVGDWSTSTTFGRRPAVSNGRASRRQGPSSTRTSTTGARS